MVIFHFFVSVILVGLGLNRSVESYYRVGLVELSWVGSKPSHGFAEIPSTHNSGSAAPSIDQSLWSHQMFIIFCWWKGWKRSQQFSFTFFVMWWECHFKIHQHQQWWKWLVFAGVHWRRVLPHEWGWQRLSADGQLSGGYDCTLVMLLIVFVIWNVQDLWFTMILMATEVRNSYFSATGWEAFRKAERQLATVLERHLP